MALEELTFDVKGVKVTLKPELHIYHDNADDEPSLGRVPMVVEYLANMAEGRKAKIGHLRYDTGKNLFIDALSDFVPTDSGNTELLEKYKEGMTEVSRVYSALLQTHTYQTILSKTYTPLTKKGIITEKHFYRNSQSEWKDIGDYWLEVLSHEELLEMADAVK